MQTATVFNIQKFCVHDGPGIRTTVFFKGCPLNCLWCHNPESQNFGQEILYNSEKCTLCGQCQRRCPQGAIKIAGENYQHDQSKCMLCETCVDFCIHNAKEVTGRVYTVNQLVAEIEKDRPFYEQSKGGVTLSGGESLCQIDFVEKLVKSCKQRGIPVAVDTCGYVPFSNYARILQNVDFFLYDLKIMDPNLHEKYTGQDNRLILANLEKLVAMGAKIFLRLPLIDGINTSDDNIISIINFIQDMKIEQVNLLPYHDIGRAKYMRLNRPYPQSQLVRPSNERLEEIKGLFEENKFKVKIGG